MAVAINATNHNLIWRAQSKPNGPWETDWAWINKTVQYDAMVAGTSREGRVVVLGQARPAAAVHFYIQSFTDDTWEGPVNLALPPGVPRFSQLTTTRSLDGRIHVFGLVPDGNVWWIYQNPEVPKPATAWSAWQPLAARRLSVMTAANSGDGTIVLAGGVFDDATVLTYYTRQTTPDGKTPADWIPWMDLTQGHLDAGSPAFRLDGGSNLNLFALGGGSEVLQTRQLPANSNSFTPWVYPSMVGKRVVQLATGIDGDRHMVIVAQDETANIYANYMRDRVTQQWSGWQQIASRNYVGPMTLDYNADGRLTLFMREATGDMRLWCVSQVAINSTAWEAVWTLLSASGLSRYGVRTRPYAMRGRAKREPMFLSAARSGCRSFAGWSELCSPIRAPSAISPPPETPAACRYRGRRAG